MLVLSRKLSEEIRIGQDITIRVVEIRGGKVRLGIVAPRNMSIDRVDATAEDSDSVEKTDS